jgi:hypothetical protein
VALRKSNGDVQRAACEILDMVESRREAAKDRARQRKLGLTADKVDTRAWKHVDACTCWAGDNGRLAAHGRSIAGSCDRAWGCRMCMAANPQMMCRVE